MSKRSIKIVAFCILTFLVTCFLLVLIAIDVYRVPTSGMVPALRPGANEYFIRYFTDLKKGDVICFNIDFELQPPSSPDDSRLYFSRVAAIPGDRIEKNKMGYIINGVYTAPSLSLHRQEGQPLEYPFNPLFPFLMRGDGGILTEGEKANS